MLGVLRDFARCDIQPIEVAIRDAAGRPALRGYTFVNVLRLLEGAVHVEMALTHARTLMGSTNTCFMEHHVRSALVPSHVHLFRPSEVRATLVVSGELAAALHSAKLTGLSLTPCAVI